MNSHGVLLGYYHFQGVQIITISTTLIMSAIMDHFLPIGTLFVRQIRIIGDICP